jgi:hypothetical protein
MPAAGAAPTKAASAVNSKNPEGYPTLTEYSSAHSVPLRGADLQREKAKEAQANAYVAARTKAIATMTPAAAAAASSLNLGEPYIQQITDYYCGAATTAMVAGYLHTGWSGATPAAQQQRAAHWLNTTTDGTAWVGNDNVPYYPGTSSYPVMDVLNYTLYVHHRALQYVATPLPSNPTGAQQAQFRNNLVSDINAHLPEADNQFTGRDGQLPYQPPNRVIYHWWSARGYQNNGNITLINDPAKWGSNGEKSAWTTGGNGTVVTALGARGYVW